MDGLLIVDKPVGPTSHDVVARVRRALGERRIGHTGTLDPAASGVLALVVGRATRLAQFMNADQKAYDARIRLGLRTDSYDAEGSPIGSSHSGPWPSPADVDTALHAFRGTFLQRPPVYSAKKIDGRRSYAVARAHARHEAASDGPRPPLPVPDAVPVTLSSCIVTACRNGDVELSLVCSAGFYVRSLAHDLGERLGIGAHLTGLRRTRSGRASIDEAQPLASLEADPAAAREALIPMAAMLPQVPAVVLTESGARRARHGALLGPGDVTRSDDGGAEESLDIVRLLSSDGQLLGMARRDPPAAGSRGGSVLRPTVVLV